MTDAVETITRPRPGWPEFVVGLAVLFACVFGLPPLVQLLGADRAGYTLFFTALSAIAALAGFAAAAALRVRSWSAFGVCSTSWRWLLVGLGGGLVAYLVSRLVAVGYLVLTGDTSDPQSVYWEGAGGGPTTAALAFVFLAVATPIGEELLFRGVVATVLLRYGAAIGVVGSAVVFALAHGLNSALGTALVVGLIAAELRRRSGSVWPGVVVHVVNNSIGALIAFALFS